MKRLGLFVFFDKDGYVARYVEHIVKELKSNSQKLVIICNGNLLPEGRSFFEKYTDQIFVRENSGFDAHAWKETLTKFIGWKTLEEEEYDEVLVMNDICYGPIYPLSEILNKMGEQPNLDFWGITRHYQSEDLTGHHKDGIIPEHIQSYFFAVRKKMLVSPEFKLFWENMPRIRTYDDAVGNFETEFTRFFQERNFTWNTYVDESEFKGAGSDNFCVNYALPFTLLSEKGMPFLRRKSLTQTIENSTAGPEKEPKRAIDYIMNHTSYDVSMIWEDLLRKYNIADLYSRLHLDFVLPREGVIYPPAKQYRIALLMHIYYEGQLAYCVRYAKSMPEYADIYITTTDKNFGKVKDAFIGFKCRKLDVRAVKDRGRDMAALFVGCKDVLESNDYDLICAVHDKKSPQVGVQRGLSFRDLAFENVLSTKAYVTNIIGLFEKEPFLGYAGFPLMIGQPYWPVMENPWASPNNFNTTSTILNKCDIHVPISADKPPIVYANIFWCRPDALKPLVDLKLDYDDFPEEPMDIDGTLSHGLERAVTYVAQSQGYFSGALYTDEYASVYIPALTLYIRRKGALQAGRARIRTRLKDAIKALLEPHKRAFAFVRKMRRKLRRQP